MNILTRYDWPGNIRELQAVTFPRTGPLERALRVGDEASGTRVLEDIYREMADKPVTVDLPNLCRELGIQRSQDGDVSFVDDAPLASVPKSITAGPDSR